MRPTPRWIGRKLLGAARFPDRAMARLDHNETRVTELDDRLREAAAQTAAHAVALEDLRTTVERLLAAQDSSRLSQEAAQLQLNARAATDLARLALRLADVDPPRPAPGPLVSIVVATWNRADCIAGALDSVVHQTYPAWECLVVDDGSDDDTEAVVRGYLVDPRFTFEQLPHGGAPAARNRGLELASGDLVSYLDSDNRWHPTHLARAVDALVGAPESAWALSGQVIVDEVTGDASLRDDLRSPSTIDGNFADLNAITHRRAVIERIGAFDAALTRLSDWDLAIRLASMSPPLRVRAATSTYITSVPGRISNEVAAHVHAHAIRSRHRGEPAAGLRVLLAEWHYPQLTETYISAMVDGLRRLGADVDVWSQDDVAVPYPSPVRVHRGELTAAIEAARPHLVLTHWLHKGVELRPVTRAAGLPHVVRTHGFEYRPETVALLLEDPGVLVHTFPHLVDPAWSGSRRLVPAATCFDDERYRPTLDKDPTLVVRTAAGLLTKDLETFLLAAKACPDHRFVLVLGHARLVEERTEVLRQRAADLGSPCEVLVDLPHDEVAALLSRAGTYLHTHGTDHPVSMPMSIAEAMATGCWVLGRDLPGMRDYLGRGGDLYDGRTAEDRAAAAAQMIRASAAWSDEQWRLRWERSSDSAYERFANRDVVERMVASWRQAFDLPPGPVSRRSLPSGAR